MSRAYFLYFFASHVSRQALSPPADESLFELSPCHDDAEARAALRAPLQPSHVKFTPIGVEAITAQMTFTLMSSTRDADDRATGASISCRLSAGNKTRWRFILASPLEGNYVRLTTFTDDISLAAAIRQLAACPWPFLAPHRLAASRLAAVSSHYCLLLQLYG